jgi:tetratricopeptide (TPR) repeat protein
MGVRASSLAASIVACLLAPCSNAAWVRVASPQVEIFTDAGERSGRSLLARFEEIRRVLQVADGTDPEPVRVFEFSTEAELHLYHARVAGFFQGGPERNYIALHSGPEAGRIAFHEYVHLVLSHAPTLLPRWFEEGTAEFYSTLERSGNRWHVGEPIDSRLTWLGGGRWLSARELDSVTPMSDEYGDPDRNGLFYAQSWALVHMLSLSPAWRAGMPSFVLLLSEGRTTDDAFRTAFGKTLDQAVAALPGYLRNIHGETVGEAAPASVSPIRVEPLQPIPATLALVDFALNVNRMNQARLLLTKLNSGSPEVAAMAGALARAEHRDAEARQLLTRAIELGSQDAATYFEYAMVEQDAGAKATRVEELLDKVIALKPNFADAQFLLGVRKTDDGSYAEAIGHLKIATQLRPRRSDYWHALGYAQSKAGHTNEVLASARRALATASTTGEEGMAQGLIALAQERPAAPIARRPRVVTPQSWTRRKGDTLVEGVLTRFDCEGGSAKIVLRSAEGHDVTLNVLHPGEIELVNPPSEGYQFGCGAQEIPVIIEYFSAGRDVTRIEFRP